MDETLLFFVCIEHWDEACTAQMYYREYLEYDGECTWINVG